MDTRPAYKSSIQEIMRWYCNPHALKYIALLVVLLPSSLSAAGSNDEKALSAMPKAEHVLNTITGADILDRHARQMAALRVLSEMVTMNELVDYRIQRRPQEIELLNNYSNAMKRVSDMYKTAAPKAHSSSADLKSRYMVYYISPNFETEVVHPLLGADARIELSVRAEKRKQEHAEEREIAAQDSVEQAKWDEHVKRVRGEAIRSKSASGLGMIGFGVFLFVVASGVMRSTKESGLAAVGFVLILVSIVLICAGLTEFGDLL